MSNNSENKNSNDVASFFENSEPTVNDSSEDKKSDQEEDSLFSNKYTGGFKNIDVWVKHEEFRIRKLDRESERLLRERNAKLAFWFSLVWAIFIVLFIILKGFLGHSIFVFSQAEFLFVIGSLTTSIFAFYILVLKYLFYRK